MSLRISARRCLTVAAFAVAAATLPILATAPAQAGNEPYFGVDFGHGFGIGLGVPPSAYDACPSYGWGYRPYRCHYRPVHYRHYHHHYREHQYREMPPAPPSSPQRLGPSDE
jgi:hypothetical protein